MEANQCRTDMITPPAQNMTVIEQVNLFCWHEQFYSTIACHDQVPLTVTALSTVVVTPWVCYFLNISDTMDSTNSEIQCLIFLEPKIMLRFNPKSHRLAMKTQTFGSNEKPLIYKLKAGLKWWRLRVIPLYRFIP